MARTTTLTAIILAAGACATASAQDALGDGRALDNSLSTQSRYNARRPSLAEEFRFRNAIVTGNAPAGLSFRGDVGYRAPGEFLGELGSNDLFSFRRDSLNSGLAGMGIRGSEALQFQFALTTGGRPPQNLIGSYTVPRAGGSLYVPSPGIDPAIPDQPIRVAEPEPFDPGGTLVSSLRSPSSFEANRGYQPMLLAREKPVEGEDWYGVTASELRGVSRSELTLPEPPPGRIDQSLAPERVETSFTALQSRLNEQAGLLPAPATEPTDTRSPWEIRLDELRRDLLEQILTPQPAPEVEEAPEGPPAPSGLPDDEGGFDPTTLELLRIGGGEPAHDFVGPDVGGVYAEHMRAGQSAFRAGRYFDAEARFAQALSIQPNDVTAQMARIHAQLGAGMYLSAALNLRTILFEHPTVVSARYDASLLPDAGRLPEIVAALREGVRMAGDEAPGVGGLRRARASGLLLAYLGRQTGDEAMVAEGIAGARQAIERGGEGGGTDNLTDQRLLDLIEAVWAPDKTE
jgi:hypothetical protein